MKKILIVAFFILAAKSIKCEDRTSEIFLSLAGKNNYDNYFVYDNAQRLNVSGSNTKVSECLNDSASFVLRENSGNLGLTLGSIRGFGSNQTAVVYDGIKLPKDITSAYDLSLIPLISAEKIYLLNGGWSSVFGSNAEGGVIGIKTQKIKKDSQNLEIISDYGSYESKRYAFKSGISINNVSALISAENYNSRGFQENSYANKNSLTNNLVFDFNKYGEFSLNMFAVDLKRGLPSGTPADIKYFDGKKEKKANRIGDWQKDKNLFLNLKHNWNIGEFENQISYSRNNLLRQAYQFGSLSDINTYSNNILAQSNINGLGFGFESEEVYLKSSDYGNHKIKNYGYFAKTKADLSDKITSRVYLRYDDNKNYENVLSPKISFECFMKENYKLSYSLSSSWRAPNFADIYGSSLYWYDPNPDIKPEKSVSNEISFGYFGTINLNMTAYYYSIDDKISVHFDPNTWHSKSVNMAKGYNKGVEFNLECLYRKIRLNLGVNLMDVKGKNKNEGKYKKLAYSPDYKLNFAAAYEKKGLSAAFKAIKVSDQYSAIDKTGKKIPSYEVFYFDISQKIKNISLSFSVENIFDERYATTADNFNGYYPANPRNYAASVSLEF